MKKVTDGTNIIPTDYLTGFQYVNAFLHFFPHKEGYYDNLTYSYVYNYTDHLGNVRLSFADNDKNGSLGCEFHQSCLGDFCSDWTECDFIEENNYYPFGMKHKGYNDNSFGGSYKYKYQGQERQDELGLNWDSFKWRNYDYMIGRFMSIDPLTEEYHTWSPYAFSGNRVVDARELEGLEPYILFNSKHDAAINFGEQYNGYSITRNRELKAGIYEVNKDNNTFYAYTQPIVGTEGFVASKVGNTELDNKNIPKNPNFVGDIHSHGVDNDVIKIDGKDFSSANEFSNPDIRVYENTQVDENGKHIDNQYGKKVDGYVTTPNGSVFYYNPNAPTPYPKDNNGNKLYNIPISTNIPSDPQSGQLRKNNILPNVEPVVKPAGDIEKIKK